ncbi:MAG: oligosaccharide flippase family protein [Candidatus Gracilibacteria bacterium]|nr:oligosaccharide flippase family protein [Candidatus Gracilibacteria bacterium]
MIEQHNSLSEKFIKKGIWLYLFSFIIGPLGYIIKIIISTELSVSEVGILYGIISLITLVSAYNDLGLTDGMNYYIPKFITENRYDKVKSILAYTIIAQLITGMSIALFFFFGSEYIANSYFKDPVAGDILKIFALFFLGINIFQVISTFFMVIQNTFYNKILDFSRTIFMLLFILFLYYFDIANIINISYIWLIGMYFGVIFGVFIFYNKYYKIYLKKEKILWEFKLFKTIFIYSLTVFIGVQAGVILSQIDMQMIIYLLGTTDAGYYTNYLSIISIPFMIIGPIFGLLFPMFSEMYSKNEIDKINQVKSIFQKNFLAISIAFNMLFFIFAEILAIIFFGEKFLTSGVILKYSILFLAFNFLLQMNFSIMASIGKVKERIYIVVAAIFFSLIFNYILINSIGVSGAALSSGLGWIIIWIFSEIALGKQFKIKFDFKYLFKNILSIGTIGILSYYYLLPLFDGLNRFELLIYFCLYSAIYFGLFALINLKEFKYFIGEIKSIRKK